MRYVIMDFDFRSWPLAAASLKPGSCLRWEFQVKAMLSTTTAPTSNQFDMLRVLFLGN